MIYSCINDSNFDECLFVLGDKNCSYINTFILFDCNNFNASTNKHINPLSLSFLAQTLKKKFIFRVVNGKVFIYRYDKFSINFFISLAGALDLNRWRYQKPLPLLGMPNIWYIINILI